MSKLSEMPLVTVEQITRFREAALAVEQQHDELLAAAKDVLAHREGSLPVRGWIRDTDKSRAALERLAEAIAKAGG